MKKIFLIAGLTSFSIIGFAQQNNNSINTTDTLAKDIAGNPQDRVLRLEKEVASLKSSQVEMQKQLEEIRSVLPKATKNKKPAVSRVGSKQLIWVEE